VFFAVSRFEIRHRAYAGAGGYISARGAHLDSLFESRQVRDDDLAHGD